MNLSSAVILNIHLFGGIFLLNLFLIWSFLLLKLSGKFMVLVIILWMRPNFGNQILYLLELRSNLLILCSYYLLVMRNLLLTVGHLLLVMSDLISQSLEFILFLGLNRRDYVSFKLIESVLNLVEGVLKRGSHRHHELTNLLWNHCTAGTFDLLCKRANGALDIPVRLFVHSDKRGL